MAESRMTELESLRAEREQQQNYADCSAASYKLAIAKLDARIAELEREPQRWRRSPDRHSWRVLADGSVMSGDAYSFNCFPTEARAKEVATHFRRLGLAAQWGALLTPAAWRATKTRPYATGDVWHYCFPTVEQRDGFMADAKREGLL